MGGAVNGARPAVATLLTVAAVAGGCSRGVERIHFDTALPACSDFVAVLTAVGMPGPRPGPEPSAQNPEAGLDCLFGAEPGSRPPLVAATSFMINRPTFKYAEDDPVKRFGETFVAKVGCQGFGADNPALPAGSSCYQPQGKQYVTMTVTSIAKQSGIRISLDWADTSTQWPSKLQTDALDKANTVAQAVIAKL